jgi:GDP-4-dehydro-6-deoxy-D-mannose reductase
MNVIITGASGFVGQHLIQFLKSLDCNVNTIGRKGIASVKHYTIAEKFCLEDIRNIINKVKPDFIFHLAGCVKNDSLSEQYKINVDYATYILEAVNLESLEQHTKILFVGSAAEYGYVHEEDLPIKESLCAKPLNHYGISKLTQTQMAMSWFNKDRKIIVVRPFTIIGKNMPTYLAIGSFIDQINKIVINGGKGTLHTGTLEVCRDFLSINDVVKIFWKLINNKKAYGRIINVCEGKSTSIYDIVNYCIQQSGCDIELVSTEERIRLNDMKDHFGDNQLLKQLIGDVKLTPWKDTVNTMLECK